MNNIGIYIFTNKINGKSYIGQSINLSKRYKEHTSNWKKDYGSVFHRAIRKYGVGNFEYNILEYCLIEELNEKEIYYIKKYNTLNPYGYNVATGGRSFTKPIKLDLIKVKEIIELLKNTNMDKYDICDKYNISIQFLNGMNRGEFWKQEQENYPLRENKRELIKHYCKDCGIEISKSSKGQCLSCNSISQRKVKNRPSKEKLIKELKETSFAQVGRNYGVSDNTIRKWCKGYNISHYSKDYK